MSKPYDPAPHLVKIYRLAKQGWSDQKIARYLKVNLTTFKRATKDNKLLKDALLQARGKEKTSAQMKAAVKLQEYIYEQLPEELRDVWAEILNATNAKYPSTYIENILRDKGELARKQLFVHALLFFDYNPSKACRAVNISKATLDKWCAVDPKFAQLIVEMEWHKKNFFEGAFIQLVKDGEVSAILHAARTINRDRGYGIKTEVAVHGSIQHQLEKKTSIDDLNLPLDVRKQILQAIIEKERKEQLALEPHDEVIDAEYEEPEDNSEEPEDA